MAIPASIANALQAYDKASKPFDPVSSGLETEGKSGQLDFASLLKDGAEIAIDASNKSEELSKQAIAGKADLREVIAAVSNAELTLDTVVAVRDKVISAYNDILKMPI
jgi:flagellar hook-basal body complex protein FliE